MVIYHLKKAKAWFTLAILSASLLARVFKIRIKI